MLNFGGLYGRVEVGSGDGCLQVFDMTRSAKDHRSTKIDSAHHSSLKNTTQEVFISHIFGCSGRMMDWSDILGSSRRALSIYGSIASLESKFAKRLGQKWG